MKRYILAMSLLLAGCQTAGVEQSMRWETHLIQVADQELAFSVPDRQSTAAPKATPVAEIGFGEIARLSFEDKLELYHAIWDFGGHIFKEPEGMLRMSIHVVSFYGLEAIDFSTLEGAGDAVWKAKEESAKRHHQDFFSDRVPYTPLARYPYSVVKRSGSLWLYGHRPGLWELVKPLDRQSYLSIRVSHSGAGTRYSWADDADVIAEQIIRSVQFLPISAAG